MSSGVQAVPAQKKAPESAATGVEGVIGLGGQVISVDGTADVSRSWEDNAREFAALDAGDGWPFAVLVACSVEKGTAGGVNQHNREDRNDRSEVDGKVSATAFAEIAGTSKPRVLRYLAAWDRAAKAGLVPAAAGLTPADVRTVVLPGVPFQGKDGIYEAKASGVSKNTTARSASKIIERRGADAVVDAMPDDQKVEVAAAILRDASVRDKIAEAADVMPIIGNPVARDVRRHVKESEARSTPPEQPDDTYLWQALMNLRVAIEQRPHLWPLAFAAIDEMRAEYAVDGKVRAL